MQQALIFACLKHPQQRVLAFCVLFCFRTDSKGFGTTPSLVILDVSIAIAMPGPLPLENYTSKHQNGVYYFCVLAIMLTFQLVQSLHSSEVLFSRCRRLQHTKAPLTTTAWWDGIIFHIARQWQASWLKSHQFLCSFQAHLLPGAHSPGIARRQW